MTTSAIPQTVTLTNPGDIADLVRDCAARNLPIADYGVAHRGVGHPPPREHVKLALTGGVIEHYERDLTVRAHAGVTLGALREALKPTGQFVPIDADDDLTLGEVINHHVYGALRAGYGSIRDLLLGLRYIDGEGRDIHVGGRTVKNVAGYDVTRLMVGSLGELGVVHEATLRTYAIPEQTVTAELRGFDPRQLAVHLPEWIRGDAAPAWMTLEYRASTGTSGLASFGFFGRPAACGAQLRALQAVATQATMEVLPLNPATLDETVADLSARRAWRRSAKALVKVVVPPSHIGSLCDRLRKLNAEMPLDVDALPIHGCVFAGGDLDAAMTANLDREIAGAIETGGFRVWHARPHGCEGLAPFAPLPSDLPMMQRLKQAMDPRNLFNRGRLIPPPEAACGVAS